MALYFAYGSNMDVAAMAIRCPRSRALGAAALPGFRLAAMREGWLTVAHDGTAETHGVLWDVAAQDMAALDAHEDIAGGLYEKSQQAVAFAGGKSQALVYIGANAGPGKPRAAYLAEILAAAVAWGLPAPALAALQALG